MQQEKDWPSEARTLKEGEMSEEEWDSLMVEAEAAAPN